MDDAIHHFSLLVASFTFAAFVVGVVLFRRVEVWFALYATALTGYALMYSVDLLVMVFEWLQPSWSFRTRQALARTILCVCFWLPILLHIRRPSLFIDLYRFLDRTPHAPPKRPTP